RRAGAWAMARSCAILWTRSRRAGRRRAASIWPSTRLSRSTPAMCRRMKRGKRSRYPGSIPGADRMEIQRVTRHLDAAMVEEAYRHGIFPMADLGLRVVTWHKPRRRAILPLDAFHISRSLQRRLRRGGFEVTFDRDFAGVMAACAERKPTWISDEFREVYGELHRAGKAP